MFNFKMIFNLMQKAIRSLELKKGEKVVITLLLILLFINYIKFEFSLVGVRIFGYEVSNWMVISELIMPSFFLAGALAFVWAEN